MDDTPISFAVIGSLIGGLGLFLLGMHLMTEGLKLAAGKTLQAILRSWTNTPVRGIFSGALITAVVQSSSAVTVAIIGFVNAGIMSLFQAVGVIYGSNIGTTMTAWLVALVGFGINIKAIALPAVGIGMGLSILFGNRRPGASGKALVGFGIFFLGIDILNSAFVGIGQSIDLGNLFKPGIAGLLIFVGIGSVLTILMQSSSAAMAVTLTAAGGGLIPLNAGAALIIGANLGTTSTAAVAVIGATPNAKRVAGAHVAFNLVTGIVALLILPLFMFGLTALREMAGLDSNPVPLLASFHTAFNVLGVLLMWPVTKRLVRFLGKRFRTAEEADSQPQYLDGNVAAMPELAFRALKLELERISSIARRMAGRCLSREKPAPEQMESDRRAIDSLIGAVGDFTDLMRQNNLPKAVSDLLPSALRVSRYFNEAAELCDAVAKARHDVEPVLPPELAMEADSFVKTIAGVIDSPEPVKRDDAVSEHNAALERIQNEYQNLKSRLLRAGAAGEIPVQQLVEELDLLSNIRRIGEQLHKSRRYMADLQADIRPNDADGR